uniref:Uncharacterized protein n=1 Tax=viral metagenome TaxID=1070528 RepID=A0A6C0KY82_9ZZZZ|tara:strand:+ start:14258 stop:14548 length:291 start_codon:yes stop_codon:yes gene_type:complete
MVDDEEQREATIQKRILEITKLFQQATKKDDLDFILRRFNLKCIKNNKKRSPIGLKMAIKYKIIKMAIQEPDDIFDYDYFCKVNQSKEASVHTINP